MKMRLFIFSALCLAAVAAVPSNSQRIIGGSVTAIENYPHMAALLYSWNFSTYVHDCGGSILNSRSILTAAHCLLGDTVNRWRVRVGSTWSNSGGVVHNSASFILHPNYWGIANDIAVLRTATTISFNNAVRAASIAGANYNLGDNQVVWATGWGATSVGGAFSEQLRHVQIWTVNQNTCAQRYSSVGDSISSSMVCSGWLDVGGRDQCQGDSGGPLLHNNVVVGVSAYGRGCADPFFPGVNTRVSSFSNWIVSNA